MVAQKKEYNFINYTTKNGLNSNTTLAILKDKYGFMWFGTEDGLNRFDGNTFKEYRHKEKEASSIGRGSVTAIQEDKDGNLWIGTTIALSLYNRTLNNFTNYDFRRFGWIRSLLADHKVNIWVGTYSGLYYFNPKTKKVTIYRANAANINALRSDVIISIFEDSKNRIWVGTKAGLHLFNERTHTYKRFVHKDGDSSTLSNDNITTIAEDQHGNIWVGTEGGLNLMNLRNEKFKVFRYQQDNIASLSSDRVYKMAFDIEGKLWVGTEYGLNIFDPKSEQSLRIKNVESSHHSGMGSFIGHSVRDIFIDKNGIYWISTLQGAVNKYDNNLAFFSHKQYNPFEANGLSGNSITSFAESPNGDIYVGTDTGGLNLFNRKTGQVSRIPLSGKMGPIWVVLSLERSEDKLWIGTYQDGLCELNIKTRSMKRIPISPDAKQLSSPANCLKIDSKGNLWIGTNGRGVYRYEPKTGVLLHFDKLVPQKNKYANLPIDGYVTAIEEDKQGRLWFGSNGVGMVVFDPKTNQLEYINHERNGLPLDRVQSVLCDKLGRIWVGVFGGGLCLYDTKTKKFIQYNEDQMLSNDLVCKILEDSEGKLWVSTNKGISVFDPKRKFFKNYTYHNGIQQNTFNMGAGLKCSTGEMYFGGLDGFNYFYPNHLRQNKNIPSLIVTDLKVGNKSINAIENSDIIKESIAITQKITLSYKQNFSLDFVALNYTAPQESQYTYMLEGFDKEWNNAGSATTAIYTSLDPGQYRFRLKAQSEDGSWHTPERTIEIVVNPPFWRTYYAYAIYFSLLVLGLWLSRRRAIEKLRSEFLLDKERTESERKIELEQLKIKFLTNLSHELKTPLTLVLNPVESLLTQEQSISKLETLNLINRNAKRLLNIVNQLLDFRKIEDNELTLNTTECDLILLAKEIFDSFKYISERKKIQLDFETTIHEYYTSFDKDKVERILLNLLSNAIKFTGENGSVYFHVEEVKEKGIKLIIGDTGVGFSNELSEKIFQRFFQIDNNQNILNQGSGIGLSITQEFVKLHEGIISVESEEGLGSIFTVFLPLKKMSREAILVQETSPDPALSLAPLLLEDEGAHIDIKIDKPVLLLVDDSEDIRTYLRENLKNKYKIVEAFDGKQGWQKALSSHPEIIVSDINMPNMDGIAMVKKIKSDVRTKHIPVILLTVLSEEIDQLKGLETGANDYMTKPFNFQLLDIKIGNLLESNNIVKNTYSKHITIETPSIAVVSGDEKFLLTISKHIEEHINETNLSIEELSKKMNMSRSTFYHKVLSLTGETPVEYVRSVKLKKAAILLEKSDLKISQICFDVGFANTNYFSRAFKAKYNVSPSEYIQQKRKLG